MIAQKHAIPGVCLADSNAVLKALSVAKMINYIIVKLDLLSAAVKQYFNKCRLVGVG